MNRAASVQAEIKTGFRSTFLALLRRAGLSRWYRYLIKVTYYRMIRSYGYTRKTLGQEQIIFTVSSLTEAERVSRNCEKAFIDRLLQTIKPGDIFFDVGANIGMVSLAVAAHKRLPTVVHAFEPERRNCEALARNVAANGLSQITVHKQALGDANGAVELAVDGETGCGTHSIVEYSDTQSPTELVSLRQLDTVALELSCIPTIVKIDVEGAEMSVLKGMDEVLRSGVVRDIFVELHPSRLKLIDYRAEDVLRLLERYGYCLQWQTARGNEIHVHFRKVCTSTEGKTSACIRAAS